jgi:SAM-dependent methyltransferase
MNSLTDQEEMTKQAYDSSAALWSSNHDDGQQWAEELDTFRELLPSGRVLEVGCGGGCDARELIKAGYDYHGTDVSEGLIAEAKRDVPEGKFEVKNLYDLDFRSEFDGLWCAAVLLHIPKARISDALGLIRNSLKTGALGFIAIKRGSGEHIQEDEYGKRLFVYWENDEFKDVLRADGFCVEREGYKPVSERTKWLTYFVRAG